MICSGEQTVLILPLQKEALDSLNKIVVALDESEPAILEIRPECIGLTRQQALPDGQAFVFERQSTEKWLYRETLGLKKKAYIVGGGHVSLALSKLLRDLEFFVVVLDDRQDLLTLENNQYAHRKIYCSYDEIRTHLEQGPDVFVILMTFGYRDDDRVVGVLPSITGGIVNDRTEQTP